ncbi:TonB-dependent siderophore receptor [Ottowia sp.]|uniref:TonB-dependent siderophore receptor n=1 Tax=Ottowia sp. TaxID=1898956 RepID=UPI003A8A250A
MAFVVSASIKLTPIGQRRMPTAAVRVTVPLMLALSAGMVWAADEPTQESVADESVTDESVVNEGAALPTVTVTGVKAAGLRPQTVEAGTFRGSSVMEVPSTVNVVTREALDAQAATGLYDALRNTAGVTRQQNGGDTWDQLVIRGMAVENRTNYRLNGSLPVMNFSQTPMENKERVEVLKGASALYYGFTSPAGVVNLVTKRAGSQPVSRLGFSLDSNGTALAQMDVGRRFGDEQQFGLRINAAGGYLGTYLDDVGHGNRSFASMAFDWRVNSRVTLRADLEYDRRRITEQAGIQLPSAVNGVITLPDPVDPKNLIGPDWARFKAKTFNALVRADVSLSDNWALTLEGGQSKVDRLRQLPIFRFSNAAAVATGAGDIRGNSQDYSINSKMVRAELAGMFSTFGFMHEPVFGISHVTKEQDPIYRQNYSVSAQNLYDPVDVSGSVTWGAMPTNPTTAGYETRENALYAIDRVRLTEQWQVLAGLRYTRYRSDQGDINYAPNKTTPMVAVIYRPRNDLSFYASWAKGLEEGETAPTGTNNVGTRMSPGISKQKELGVRWLVGTGTLVSAAVFDIKRPGYYTNADNDFVGSGRQTYKGLELAMQGQLTRQWGWQASAQWLRPKFGGIGADYDGKLPENAARRTASLFMNYAFAGVPGLSVNGGAYYTGRRPVNDLNQAWLGGVTLFSGGVVYSTKIAGRHTRWQLQVDNLTNKRYWAGAGTRLASGAPRTAKMVFSVDL